MRRKKKILRTIKTALYYTLMALIFVMGILLYRIFLGYVPGVNVSDLILVKTGLQAFPFFGIYAGILISFPVIMLAIDIYLRNSASYVSYLSDTGVIHLSDSAIASFITDIVQEITGVESVEVAVDIFKENRLGIHIWLDTDEKSDFVRFSERVQQRVLQDLEFNFGVKKIKYFHVYVESTNINAGGTGYKVNYQ